MLKTAIKDKKGVNNTYPKLFLTTDNNTNFVVIKKLVVLTERKRLWKNLKNLYSQKNPF